MKTRFKLSIQIMMMLLLSGSILANGQKIQNLEEIQQQALDQTDEIDLIFELLSEAADNGKLNQSKKNNSGAKLRSMRNIMQNMKSSGQLPAILGTNETMIGSLEFMTNNGFKVIPTITPNMIVKRSTRRLSLNEAQEKLQINEKKLGQIHRHFKLIGLSTINILARKGEKIVKKLKINKVAPKLLPYALILFYIACLKHPTKIENALSYITRPFKDILDPIKDFFVGEKKATDAENTNNESKKNNTSGQSKAKPASLLNDMFSIENFLKVELEPLIKLAPAAFLFSLIKDHPGKLVSILKKKWNRIFSKLKNEIIEKEDVFSKPIFNPNSLNLMEIAEFRDIKNYFKYKRLFKLADHDIHKSYLLIGQQTAGSYITDILCAQLAKELDRDCMITQLNASDFVPPRKIAKATFDKEDKLKIVLKNAKKHDICIVVIKNIDWIYEQKERTRAKLDAFLDETSSESNIIVIGLSDSNKVIGRNSTTELIPIIMDDLTLEQRVQFIKAQLKVDHAAQDLDIESIAKITAHCTLADLKKIVIDAYTLAYTAHKPLNKYHLLQSASKITKKRI